MAGEWDKIQASHKKLLPQIKKHDDTEAKKKIQAIKDALEAAWNAEDALKAALKKARKGGLKGKKPEDFETDNGFTTTLATLKKEGKQHLDQVKALKTFSAKAAAPHKELTKLMGEAKKHLNKKDKAQVKFQATLKDDFEKMKFSALAMGKLTPAETFYGARLDRVVENVINKSKKTSAAGPAGDAAKLIEKKEREKNAKEALNQSEQAEKLCDEALAKVGEDPKAAKDDMRKAAGLIDEIKAHNAAYQKVKRKNADLIKASKDKVKINKIINDLPKLVKATEKYYTDVLGKIRKQV